MPPEYAPPVKAGPAGAGFVPIRKHDDSLGENDSCRGLGCVGPYLEPACFCDFSNFREVFVTVRVYSGWCRCYVWQTNTRDEGEQ